jgi:hypothetical protein
VRIVPPKLRSEFDTLKHSIDTEVDAVTLPDVTIGAKAPDQEKADDADPAE